MEESTLELKPLISNPKVLVNKTSTTNLKQKLLKQLKNQKSLSESSLIEGEQNLDDVENKKDSTYVKKVIIEPFLTALKTGSSINELTLTITLGIVLGLFPILGLSSVICLVLALVFKLNLPLIQVVNFSLTPFAFALCVPFFKFGTFLLRFDVDSFLPNSLWNKVYSEPILGLKIIISGIFGWLIICLPLS
ncbi:hypothetical protein HK099_002208 [Clydaea vesicula]|uniref:DUF2062 domain-containing protein n=1 Tax=Clydaea vesicula TaxID=447962 RepID=A0AAD5U654_9FUNG|nr:hypothetical protein HK099_002208 [Clydaea vesicula]